MKKQVLLSICLVAMLGLIYSCQKETTEAAATSLPLAKMASEKFNVFKGPEVALGNGYARSWISISHTDQPKEIGIEITEEAFTSLPPHHVELVLPLHKKAIEVTPFEHIGLNNQPNGHFPPGVFDVPHLDAHFYLNTYEERMAIPAVSPATLPLFNLAPPAGYMPPTYMQGGPEPMMGTHWLPPPPTFLPFSRVMIYGTFNGELKFIEPMVTIAHMLSGGSTNPYLQPSKFAEAGNYPTVYNVYRDAKSGNYHITLSNFVARTAN